MSPWRCPRCERQFDRANQAHTCRPGKDVADMGVARSGTADAGGQSACHRHARVSEERIVHWIRLVRPAEVDDELEGWLRLAYDAATD